MVIFKPVSSDQVYRSNRLDRSWVI